MKGYIYFIVNQITKERYVGKTTNFSRRKSEHLLHLREQRHINKKLQSAYNKYGEDSFVFSKITFDDITKEQLNEQEQYYIQYYDSFNHGYNLTLGGDGGDTRSKLTFEQFCFAFFGNQKYNGMTNQTAKFLKVDSSTISAIRREKSYDAFRKDALKLSKEQQEKYLLEFEEQFDLKNKKPWIKQNTLDDEHTLQVMCVCSTYGRGIEQAILNYFGLSKGFIFHLMTGSGRQEIKKQYHNYSKEKRMEIGRQCFKDWHLQDYTKINIKEQYTDLENKYSS